MFNIISLCIFVLVHISWAVLTNLQTKKYSASWMKKKIIQYLTKFLNKTSNALLKHCCKLIHAHAFLKRKYWASLVAQWLRICLPMQGTWVRALVREDPMCCGATKPVCLNYWACTLEPVSHNYWDCVPQLLKPACLEPMLLNKRSHRSEKPAHLSKE